MPNIFFSSDTHCGHARIIEYCKRPFSSHEEMTEQMIQRANEVLRPGDLYYHLGDVAWSTFNWDRFFCRLNTQEIFLIWGNHDHHMRKGARLPKYIRWAHDIKNIHCNKSTVILCHYAMRTWASSRRGGIQLYGHSHNTLPGVGRQMDVGVDTNNFYPWAWEDIEKKMLSIPILKDHTAR